MEKIELKAAVRETIGNGPARVLRRQGRFPAVLYGPKVEPILLSVETREFEQVLKTSNIGQALFNLVIGDKKSTPKTAMVKELQTKPVSGDVLHVDFYEVAMDRKITVSIPVVTTGKSKGVELGGLLQIVRHELEVLCYPDKIPESIEVDITDLDIGDSIHMGEIPLDENIEIPADANFTVATVLSPKVEEEEEEEVEEGEELEEEAAEEEDAESTSEE